MKILHCIHSLSGGGAETQLKLLCGSLYDRCHEVAIFCVNDQGKETLPDGVIVVKSKSYKKYNLSIFREIADAVEMFRPDIIHAWLPASMTVPAMTVSVAKGVPCIYSYRNRMMFHRGMSYVEYVIAAICSTRIISNNLVEQSRVLFRWLYKIKRGKTIPNCVVVPCKYKKQNTCQVSHEILKFLFVGRLTKQKNIFMMIDAFCNLKRDDWMLNIYGEGELREDIRLYIDNKGLAEHVKLNGYTNEIHKVMSLSDVLVLPSLYEGMPNVMLEAMALGLPCLMSDISSHDWVVDKCDYGNRFNPLSSELLAKSLGKCFDEMYRRKLQRCGLQIASKYSIDIMAEAYISVYKDMISA